MSVSFHPLTVENYQQALAIHQSCHLFPWSESVFKDCLTSPYFAAHLEFENQVVGYYVGMAIVGEGTLMDIGLNHTHRNKGLGKLLLGEFIAQAKTNQCEEVWLEVRESNQVAIELYQQSGFTLIETRKAYYPTQSGRENGLIMRAKLK
ncbi:ribosomal protein S18-alanine N-acetyltransferase [Aliiglaciecola litoralis]|uniref:[Ribosomal protein bS18]-alanine N-acetyltransferase n=1 Tax=Aliiglaciecola litoralis TaxID=582857 RepID=A0ABN1LLP5_9ALTE